MAQLDWNSGSRPHNYNNTPPLVPETLTSPPSCSSVLQNVTALCVAPGTRHPARCTPAIHQTHTVCVRRRSRTNPLCPYFPPVCPRERTVLFLSPLPVRFYLPRRLQIQFTSLALVFIQIPAPNIFKRPFLTILSKDSPRLSPTAATLPRDAQNLPFRLSPTLCLPLSLPARVARGKFSSID